MTGRRPVRVVLDIELADGTISGDIAVGDASRALSGRLAEIGGLERASVLRHVAGEG